LDCFTFREIAVGKLHRNRGSDGTAGATAVTNFDELTAIDVDLCGGVGLAGADELFGKLEDSSKTPGLGKEKTGMKQNTGSSRRFKEGKKDRGFSVSRPQKPEWKESTLIRLK
jgi:hypothetical protein